ncbi:MAG: hypothetical protein ACTSXL_01200 [Alphaproteobacteria bacterium]
MIHIQENQEVMLFTTIEELWFWCCKGQLIRESGSKFIKKNPITTRPCSFQNFSKIKIFRKVI